MSIDVKIFDLEQFGEDIKYRFKLSSGTGLVTGIDRLAQQVAKSLLTTPGTDKRFPYWGGGADQIPPILHDGEEILSAHQNSIMFAVSKVEEDIKNSQAINPVPSDEALHSLEVMDVELTDLNKVTLFLRIVTIDKVSTPLTLSI
jgi:hypothetical protein